jgi:hypothetical protein
MVAESSNAVGSVSDGSMPREVAILPPMLDRTMPSAMGQIRLFASPNVLWCKGPTPGNARLVSQLGGAAVDAT